MAEEEPKPRTPQPIAVGGGWRFVYVALALAFAGTAAWLVLARDAPLTSSQVLVAALGAVWFTARAALAFARRG